MIWCLITLFPTFLLTDIPILFFSRLFSRTYMTKKRLEYDFPFLYTFWKWLFFFNDSENFIILTIHTIIFLTVEERPQLMWSMLITFFFLLIFLQLKLFFRPSCSFSYESHALWIFFSFLADMSSSWVCTSSALKNIIFIITNNSPKSSYFGSFFHKHIQTGINIYPHEFPLFQVINFRQCK